MLKQLKLLGGVIFDEVSFAGVDLMNEFFQAMKALEGQGHNMHVIMVGDMYQLPPVQQTFVLTAVCQVERDLLRVLDQEEALKQQFVVSEFLELKRFSFTKQMRSLDEIHTRNLTTMRGADPFVDTTFLDDYQVLCPGDFRERKWRMCHIGVRTNAERACLTLARAPAMAKELNTCVIRWYNPVKIGRDEYRDDFATLRLLAQTMPAIESLYVFRGACMLLDNINPAKQLANGTRGEFWGLVWDKSFDLVPGSTPPWRFRDEGE